MSNFKLIENYIYIYQLDKYVIIPTFPDSLSDSLGSTFASTNALARTAPVYSYSNSGPRTVQITLQLHRDMMSAYNYENTKFIDKAELGDDYIDTLIRYLQAMAMPSYTSGAIMGKVSTQMVNPPLVAVRFGNTLFVKGIVNGDVGVTYSGPISYNNKYEEVAITFTVLEVDPQDANQIAQWGSFRGLEKAISRNFYTK